MKRAALYMRVSTLDQHPETQFYDLRQMAQQRGYQIVEEYTDRISGAKAKRPGFDAMMSDDRRGRFDVVLVWASDRIARSVKHFLDVLDELNRLNIEFISFREQIDTGGPVGRAVVVISGAIAELERNLILERVRAGIRRAKLEGRHIGRKPLVLDRNAILQDRQRGHSLSQLAKSHLSPAPPSTECSRSAPQLPWRSPHEGKHRLDPNVHAACRRLRLYDRLGLRRTALPL
jgi:DNA invertase Pin-like site-specific DNA recombinase